MDAKQFFRPEDEQSIIALRRDLHRRPEIAFDLPQTVARVKQELTTLGIPYTEKYGKGSVVGYINPQCTGKTIAIRADMDALPLQEKSGVPFSSEIDGAMHACGHDAHTAMLIGTARALKRAEPQLKCRVLLLFQPAEESNPDGSGAAMMVRNGVMAEVDEIIGMHVENLLESGTLGVCHGEAMAASHPYIIEFFGASAHATMPQSGHDALAMAVKAYNDIYLMEARELSPFVHRSLSIGALQAGTTSNVIADHAKMMISVRTYDTALDTFFHDRILQICTHAAEELGGRCTCSDQLNCPPLYNHPEVCRKLEAAITAVVGAENVAVMPKKLSSEDFANYVVEKPGAFLRLGTRNDAIDCNTLPHNNDFRIDEAAFIKGSMICVQYVLNNM